MTPIAGRLGDIFGKKRVLVIALAGLALGSLMAALVSTLALMIVARVIQGLGGAIFPLAFGIIRDEFPPQRIAGSIGLMSGLLGIGGGLGIVLSGVILDNLSYHWLFWIPLIVTTITTVATIFFVPESPVRAPAGINWLGAVLLSGWLTALLLAASQAHGWGWGSPKTLGLLRARRPCSRSLWVWSELRSRHPLVDMRVMRLRPVWTTNLVRAPARLRDVQRVRADPAVRPGARVDRLRLRRDRHAGRPLPRARRRSRCCLFAPARRPALEHGRLEGAARARRRS